jgi:hypothetical protein
MKSTNDFLIILREKNILYDLLLSLTTEHEEIKKPAIRLYGTLPLKMWD